MIGWMSPIAKHIPDSKYEKEGSSSDKPNGSLMTVSEIGDPREHHTPESTEDVAHWPPPNENPLTANYTPLGEGGIL